MVKYNYTGAGELWERFYNAMVDPWTLDENERRQARRDFLHDVTRGEVAQYVDYINEYLENVRPVDDAKSRYYDFELIRGCEEIRQAIIDFGRVATI